MPFSRDRRLRILLMIVVVIAAAAMAWAITTAVDRSRLSAHHAAHFAHSAQKGAAAAAVKAQRASCYATNVLLWNIDRYNYASWRRDTDARVFLHALAGQHRDIGDLSLIVRVFAGSARDAYWQPLMHCSRITAAKTSYHIAVARPISVVNPNTIQRVLEHSPTPPK